MELQWTSGPLSEVVASIVLTQKWSHIYLDVCHSNSTCIVTNASSHHLDVFGPKLNHSNYEFALYRTPWLQIFAWLWKVTYVSKFLHFFFDMHMQMSHLSQSIEFKWHIFYVYDFKITLLQAKFWKQLSQSHISCMSHSPNISQQMPTVILKLFQLQNIW